MKKYYIELSKAFPLAYKEMEDTDTTFKTRVSLEYGSKTSDGIMVPNDLRDLYDWFDGLKIEVEARTHRFDITWKSKGAMDFYGSNVGITDRDQAEREAFKKAFEIREEQLKLKQK